MERKFILSCCSTVDLPYSYMQSRDIPVLFYTYVVDGQEYVDDMGRDPEALPRFYRFLEAGKLPQTSQINVGTYLDFFEAQLEKGDLLHIAFTSGQSGSVHNAVAAAKLLQEKYPDKKLVVIDSLCSSSGYGLLVDAAADLRDSGATLEETARWVLENRNKVHHQFFSSNMTQFRRTGRVSGTAAMVATMMGQMFMMVATIMNICPIMVATMAAVPETRPVRRNWVMLEEKNWWWTLLRFSSTHRAVSSSVAPLSRRSAAASTSRP